MTTSTRYSDEPEIVTHTTGKGKVLRGIVRTDISQEQAKEIDPYTFKKNGGWFIREKHLGAEHPVSDVIAKPAPKPTPVEIPVSDVIADTGAPTQAAERALPFGVTVGTSKQARRDINASVARLVTSDATSFNDADKALMRQYSGNGGCGDSLNEFYTDPAVATAMWDVLAAMGIKSGEVMEPSCGAGVYLHTAPDGIKVTGVELDPISATVAKVLHGGRHEVVNSSLERFATTSGGRRFKAVIGNVPFGLRGSFLKDDKKELKTAEGYFVDTALDMTEPGGVVALIVPTGLMDAKSQRKTRERLLRKGEFVGALRMPNTAFEHSHTGVTSDIVFFRKRPEDVSGALATVDQDALKKLGVWDDDYLSGGYFEGRGAEHVLGTMEPGWRAKAGLGQDITVTGSMAGVPDAIRQWRPDAHVLQALSVQEIVEALGDDEKAVKRAMGGAMVRPYASAKIGDTKVEDGITYVLQGDPPRWHRADDVMEHGAVKDAKPLADQIEMLMTGRGSVNRQALEDSIRAYVALHGIPSKSDNLVTAAGQDKTLHRLIGAVGPDGRLSDVVTGRVSKRVEGSLETAATTLAAESESGAFSVADLAERSGKDEAEVSDALHASSAYAYIGGGQWTTMDSYLTGELWPKLDAARAALAQPDLDAGAREKFSFQARRLDETIAPKSLEDVEIMINSAFLPTKVLQAWLNDKLDAYKTQHKGTQWADSLTPTEVTFEKGIYTIRGGMAYGDNDLLSKYLNRTGVRQDDLGRIERLNDEFKQWLLASSMRDEIEDLYNRKFRGFVAQDWSESPIDIPCINPDIKLNAYHWSSLRWALHQGRGIIADDVGLGKSFRGLMLARLAKIYGKANKPAFVVPKSVLANWVASADQLFPGARVLVIGETYTRDKAGNLKSKSDNKTERDRKYHDMTQNDYDFVFISQPAFNDLDVDPITKGTYVNDDFWVQRGDSLGNAGDKKLNKVRESYKQAVAEREFGKRTDAIYFNDLGVDMLITDEMQGYKNLYAAKARFGESPKFLGGQGQSNRAFDMSFKTRWLREQNGGKGVYGLSATPTKNSPLEIYSMLSYIAPEEFEKIGIRNSEEFLDRYCMFKNEKILGTDAGIDDALVTVGFKNLDELREIMARYIMRRTAKDVGLKLPEAKQEMHLVEMSPEQHAVYGELRAMLAEAGKKGDSTGDAHVFSIMDKMAKAALDLELLDPVKYAGAVSPKYEAVADDVKKRVKDGGQIVFCEAIGAHKKILESLVKRGIPRSRIAILNATEASSGAARQNISDAFNDGRLDVVIGNKTMEEGINLQKRTDGVHHMDIPWDPATLQQRNGRGVRQGNVNEAIGIHSYLSRGSFDGYRYQSMRAKKDWSEMLWNGGDRVDNLAREGVFSRDDMMIMMSADPEGERAKMESDKAAALQRHTAEKRVEAAGEFVRFQSLKRSYSALKNKNTASGERLRMQIERSKTGLAHNEYFTAKGALDSNDEVLIHPATGEVVQRDMGMDVSEADGSTSRWVVTGVDPVEQTVSMRKYGDTTGHRGVTVPAKKLETGTKSFKFDKDAEAKEVGEKLAADANAKLSNIKNYKDVMSMPSAVLEANHDLIQRQLKDGVKSYSVHFEHGSVPMVNKETGAIQMMESYEHPRHHDTHDYLLPTDAMKEKAIHAWMDARRRSSFDVEYVSRTRGPGSRSGVSDRVAKRDYSKVGASYSTRNTNPMTTLLDRLSGGERSYGVNSKMVKEASARFDAEQMARVRGAKTTAEALKEAIPMGKNPKDGKGITLPAKALAMIWARAKLNGDLGKTVGDVAPGHGHDRYVFSGGISGSLQNALVRMARHSGHDDLALAMARAGAKHLPARDAKETYDAVMPEFTSENHAAERLRMALSEAERGGFADSPASSNYNGYYDPLRGKTKRQHLTEQIAEAEAHQARKAAKEAA